jgi:hypothetical protein
MKLARCLSGVLIAAVGIYTPTFPLRQSSNASGFLLMSLGSKPMQEETDERAIALSNLPDGRHS